MVVARSGVDALDERADPDGDVLACARRPELRVTQGGEQCAELVDDGLILGGEGAGRVAAATEETLHWVAYCLSVG